MVDQNFGKNHFILFYFFQNGLHNPPNHFQIIWSLNDLRMNHFLPFHRMEMNHLNGQTKQGVGGIKWLIH